MKTEKWFSYQLKQRIISGETEDTCSASRDFFNILLLKKWGSGYRTSQ